LSNEVDKKNTKRRVDLNKKPLYSQTVSTKITENNNIDKSKQGGLTSHGRTLGRNAKYEKNFTTIGR
jgi:hypothetical protein